MHYFPRPPEIGPDEGFDPAKDIFNRAPVGKGLTGLLNASSDPLVIALNGEWGTGKSTFLKMWAGQLRNDGFPVILFDAFAHDYIADAFEALAGEILDLAKSLSPATARTFKEAAKSAGKVLLRAGVAMGVRAATAGVMDASSLSGIVEDAKEAIGDATDKAVEEALEGREDARSTFAAFRKSLSQLPALLKDTNKPLVFIIDELDRCKPSFALQLLERIKHFFAVPNVHFVLGVHMEQLESSVRVAYGNDINASYYLQKFISLTVDLEIPAEHRRERSELKYVEFLRANLGLNDDPKGTLRYTSQFIANLAVDHRLTFRSIEKIMTTLALAHGYTKEAANTFSPIIAGLCVMKVVSPPLYRKAKSQTLSFSEIQYFFDIRRENTEWNADFFHRWWRYCLDPDFPAEEIVDFGKHLFFYSFRSRHEIVSHVANSIIDRFSFSEPT